MFHIEPHIYSVSDLDFLLSKIKEDDFLLRNDGWLYYNHPVSFDIETSSFYEENELRIIVADKGCGIEDVQQAMQPLFTTGGEERAGLGFAVMESFMDQIKVSSKSGRGTRVTLVKKLGSR